VSGSTAIARLYTGAEHLRTKSAQQLAIRYDQRSWAEHEGDKLLRAAAATIQRIGRKEVAYDLNVSESLLDHTFARRGRHYARLDWVPYLVAKSPDDELARALVAPGGWIVERAPELTAEERLTRLEATLAEHLGPELRAALLERAYGGRR